MKASRGRCGKGNKTKKQFLFFGFFVTPRANVITETRKNVIAKHKHVNTIYPVSNGKVLKDVVMYINQESIFHCGLVLVSSHYFRQNLKKIKLSCNMHVFFSVQKPFNIAKHSKRTLSFLGGCDATQVIQFLVILEMRDRVTSFNTTVYYTAGSSSGQDDSNPAL